MVLTRILNTETRTVHWKVHRDAEEMARAGATLNEEAPGQFVVSCRNLTTDPSPRVALVEEDWA